MDHDEKLQLSLGLNRALAKQLDKRFAAGRPSEEKASAHMAAVTTADDSVDIDDYFALWDRYYPTIVSLLGWADFVLPGKAVKIIKALLAVANNNLLPILREGLK